MNEGERRPQQPSQPSGDVDRTAIRRLLALSPAERFRLAVEEARNLAVFEARLRK